MTFIAALRCDRIDAPYVLDGPIIRAVGARLLFLPPYSPDLNPIEHVFAKARPSEVEGLILLRKAAEHSVEASRQHLSSLLDAFPPQESLRSVWPAAKW